MLQKKMWNKNKVSIVLPTYNEKDSICGVIRGFESLGFADEIIVVNNNAVAGTSEEVKKTSAKEVFEKIQGYGASIMRGLREATGDFIIICEPDGTLEPKDALKLMAYTDSCDFVLGTRTHRDFIWSGANMGWFIRLGNWSLAKLIEVLFNTTHLSDVGCTYKLIKSDALKKIIDKLKVTGPHAGPEMMILAFKNKIKTVEVPVNYYKRVGVGYTSDYGKAFEVGLNMIKVILRFRLLGRS